MGRLYQCSIVYMVVYPDRSCGKITPFSYHGLEEPEWLIVEVMPTTNGMST